MPIRKLSQKSFVSGQYDRAAQNQESYTQGGIVATGLSSCKNVLSSDKGELRKRLGTKFIKELSGSTVVIPFRMPDENDIVITVSTVDNKVKGYRYNDGALIPFASVGPQADVAFPAGNTWGDGNAGEKTVTNGDWTVDFTYTIPGPPYVSEYPGHLLNASDGLQIRVNTSDAQSVSFRNDNGYILTSVKFWFWCQDDTSYKYNTPEPIIEYSDDGNTWYGVQTSFEIGEYTPISYTPPECHTVMGQTVCTPAQYLSKCSMVITQTQSGQNHPYWRIYFTGGRYSRVKMQDVQALNSEETTVFEAVNPYTEDQLKKIKYAQDNTELYIACEGVIPYRIVYNNGQLTFSSFTPTNTSTLWQTMGGYPASVAVFQGRLWFAGFEIYPQTVIASKFDDYETFNDSSPAQYDDYLKLRCNQLKTMIRNIIGGQNVLYCFSEDGISMIDGGSAGLIATNQNIEFHLKNRMPAGNATPAFKDDVMLYSSSDGTKLYGVDFDLLVNRFQVSDLAIYAKDVTTQKITELHYLNNESKLVYALTEQNTMMALNYSKGQYQGFFPLDFGGAVYDIAPFKFGRDYKLLMVVFRDGNWYLEEKLDVGKYVDTSKPRMSAEEKKWATYDNLENNIALDCYQTYDESFRADVVINDSVAETTDDLSAYIGKSVMFGQMSNQKNWCMATIDSVADNGYNITIEETRGDSNIYDIAYPEFTTFQPNLPQTANVAVISEGRYFDAQRPDGAGTITLPLPCHKLIYGVTYEALAIIKIQTPYESMKTVVQVDLSVIDTTHLELGTNFSDTQTIEKINDSSYYDLTDITMNDTYRVVLGDTPEMTKSIVFRSNKGVPFTINAVEVYVNYSNLGGD